jgi:hypothetical protein
MLRTNPHAQRQYEQTSPVTLEKTVTPDPTPPVLFVILLIFLKCFNSVLLGL